MFDRPSNAAQLFGSCHWRLISGKHRGSRNGILRLRQGHGDIAKYFSRIKSLYFVSLPELLRRIEPSLVTGTPSSLSVFVIRVSPPVRAEFKIRRTTAASTSLNQVGAYQMPWTRRQTRIVQSTTAHPSITAADSGSAFKIATLLAKSGTAIAATAISAIVVDRSTT